MCISLRIRDDVSITDLLAIARSMPVVKTPHVGNHSLNNLFAMQCGFPVILVDTTVPEVDRNANPHYLIKGGRATPLLAGCGSESKLTTHVNVSASDLSDHGFLRGRPLYEGHLEQTLRVFPDLSIETAHQRYARYGCLTEQILEMATDAHPQIWYRHVTENGHFTKVPQNRANGIRGWQDVKGSWFLPPRTSGWVIPNHLAILHDMVVQQQESGSSEVWMLSGPDMASYLPRELQTLCILWKALASSLGLPAEITINLVPFTDFGFVVRTGQRKLLDILLMVACEGGTDTAIRTWASRCSDLNCGTKNRKHFSQHDMTTSGDLYAPEELFSLPLREVRQLKERILQA